MDNLSSDDEFISDGIDDGDDLIAEFGKALEEQSRIWEQKMCPYQNILTERFYLSEEDARCFLVDADHIAYSVEEFSEVFAYYLKEFGDIGRLHEFVKRQSTIDCIGHIERKNTLFTIRPYTIFGERIRFIEHTFQLTREECISVLIQNPSWLYRKQEYFSCRINELSDTFEVNNEAIAALILKYPFILGKRELCEHIYEIANYYGVTPKKVTAFLLDYPSMINQSISFYKWAKIGKELFDEHWLIELITPGQNGCAFGGYRTFQNLLKVIGEIRKNFGEIVQHYIMKHGDDVFFAVQTKKDNDIFFISIGADAVTSKQRAYIVSKKPEEELLEQIFGKKHIPTEEEELLHCRQEYVCKIKDIKTADIKEILYFMSCVSALGLRRKFSLKSQDKTLLITSNIAQFDFPPIPHIDDENLYLTFDKIFPDTDKFCVRSLMEKIKDDILFSKVDNGSDD